ncbi:electron transfer flavoprotein subunit beta/FixA family protein [Ligilactobacillus hohenheimensis]|uniref:electron transfer flavoprotein subunit beta/FixA family protein n=1 Tax=Ligilactobacillus hohenheimensis TaxID=2991832 RepID=UPI0024B8D93B|nr:electron transfer flavoprotein subunit beta/FixA family protein [Ligilactobacillus hohenheimensis]
MRVIVCIKQILKVGRVHLDDHNNLMRAGVPGMMNPADKQALELALTIKNQHPDTEIVALSMGPADFNQSLHQAMALGADRAVLLSSRAFGGADTLATAKTLVAGIQKLGGADLILFGSQAQDADTGQVGPLVATKLNLPQVTYMTDGTVDQARHLVAHRLVEQAQEEVTVALPAVGTVSAPDTADEYHYPSLHAIRVSMDTPVTVWDETDLELAPQEVGLKGSPTVVKRVFSPKQVERKHVQLPAAPQQAVNSLLEQLPVGIDLMEGGTHNE